MSLQNAFAIVKITFSHLGILPLGLDRIWEIGNKLILKANGGVYVKYNIHVALQLQADILQRMNGVLEGGYSVVVAGSPMTRSHASFCVYLGGSQALFVEWSRGRDSHPW